MTAKERARLHGFWTHQQTGEYIVVYHTTTAGETLARQVGKNTKTLNKLKLRIWVDELKEQYVKGMIEVHG